MAITPFYNTPTKFDTPLICTFPKMWRGGNTNILQVTHFAKFDVELKCLLPKNYTSLRSRLRPRFWSILNALEKSRQF